MHGLRTTLDIHRLRAIRHQERIRRPAIHRILGTRLLRAIRRLDTHHPVTRITKRTGSITTPTMGGLITLAMRRHQATRRRHMATTRRHLTVTGRRLVLRATTTRVTLLQATRQCLVTHLCMGHRLKRH